MAKQDRQEKKRLARMRQDLERGLRRGDAELAIQGLVSLGRAAVRPDQVGEVARLFAARLDAARVQRDLATIDRLAGLLRDGCWLLDALSNDARHEVAFAMALAGARRGDATLARSWHDTLRADLSQRAPELLARLDVLTVGGPEDLEDLVERPPHIEVGAELVPPAAPIGVEAVESSVLASAACLDPERFHRCMRQWMRAAADDVRRAIARVVVGVLERNLVVACEADNDAAAVDAAKLLVDVASAAEAEAVLLFGLRVGFDRLVRRGRTGVLGVLAPVALRDRKLRELTICALGDAHVPESAKEKLVDLLWRLCNGDPVPMLLARSLELHDERDVPDAFVAALERSMRRGQLEQFVADGPRERATLLLHAAVDLVAWPVAADLVERCTARAPSDRLPVLASAAATLLGRCDTEPLEPSHAAKKATFGDLTDLVIELDDLLDGEAPVPPEELQLMPRSMRLPPELWGLYEACSRQLEQLSGHRHQLGARARAFLDRVGERLLPHHGCLFEMMVCEARNDDDARRIVWHYLGDAPSAPAWMEALRVTDMFASRRVHQEIRKHLPKRASASDLAELFELASDDAPDRLVLEIAKALSAADENFEGPRSGRYAAAVRMARALVHTSAESRRPPSSTKKKAAKRTAKKKAAKKKAAKRKSTEGVKTPSVSKDLATTQDRDTSSSAAEASQAYSPGMRPADSPKQLSLLETMEQEPA